MTLGISILCFEWLIDHRAYSRTKSKPEHIHMLRKQILTTAHTELAHEVGFGFTDFAEARLPGATYDTIPRPIVAIRAKTTH